MIVVIHGVGTHNKGAELMLYAVLQEIERKDPKAIVYLHTSMIAEGLEGIKTNLQLRELPYSKIIRAASKTRLTGILNRIGIYSRLLNNVLPVRNADYFLDASGLHFSDKTNIDNFLLKYWQQTLKSYYNQGTKIIFLPQQFGPIEKSNTQKAVAALDKYATLLMPRDEQSHKIISNAVTAKEKIIPYKDFTSLVEGIVPPKYNHLKDAVCIIPNSQMYNKGAIGKDKYIEFINGLNKSICQKGYKTFLLDHANDRALLQECIKIMNNKPEIVSGLNALEVKGLISQSYACISSRFHGAASALNEGIPCLVTSWSHKYEELLKEYNMSNSVLDINNLEECKQKIERLLDKENNHKTRQSLLEQKGKNLSQAKQMWSEIWALQQANSK